MILNNINQIFSDMNWLEKETIRNDKSEGKNKKSNFYYENLKMIRDKQKQGIIPFEEYKKVGIVGTIEYGYYIANIHYELFECNKDYKNILEDRIIFFIQNAPDDIFKYDDSWFRINFYNEYSNYLRQYYDDEYKNYKEIEIYKMICERV